MQPVTVKRARKKKTTRVAQLEQKLDGLVHLLTSKEHSYMSPDSARTNAANSPETAQLATQTLSEPPHILTAPKSDPGQPSSRFLTSIDDTDAESYLNLFKNRIAPNFPFVTLAPEYDAGRLRLEKPALFRAVMMASNYHDMHRLLAHGEELLVYFTDRILLRGEKTLELLQGLLLYMSWFHSLLHMKRRITLLLQLGNALVTDLGYVRAPQASERHLVSVDWARAMHGANPSAQPGVRTLEERRAYCGMFYLSSTVTSYHRELHSLRPTPYLEECCAALENAAEYPEDVYLVKLTRLQIMTERIAQTFTFQGPDAHLGYYTPVRAFLQPYKNELDRFKASIPDDLPRRELIMLHFHTAEIYLYEVAIFGPSHLCKIADSPLQRVEILYACLYSIKAFHEVLDTIPTESFFDYPVTTWMQSTHAVVNLSKMSMLEVEGWEPSQIREVVDLSRLLDKLSARFRNARAIGILPTELTEDDPDIFSRFARRLLGIKEKFDLKVAASKNVALPTPAANAEASMVEDAGAMPMLPSLDDEAFWQDILGDWDATR